MLSRAFTPTASRSRALRCASAALLGLAAGCGPANGTDPRAARGTWAVPEAGLVLYQPNFAQLGALDVRTGEELWRLTRRLDPDPPYARLFPTQLTCAPQLAPNGQILLRYFEGLYSVEARSGRILWMQNLNPPPLCAAATPDSGAVVVVARRRGIAKFDAAGQLAWRVQLPGEAIAVTAPTVVFPSGDILVRTRQHVVSLSPTGTLNWQREAGEAPPSTPLVD